MPFASTAQHSPPGLGWQLLKTPKLIAASACLSSASSQFESKPGKASWLHPLLAFALVFAGATFHAISLSSIPPASHSHPHPLGDGLTTYRYDSEGRMESASTGQGEDAPTTKYAHNGLGQRVFKTEPLYSSGTQSSGSNKNLNNLLADDDEPQEPAPGLIQQILNFFSKLWSPSTSDAEKLGFSYLYAEDGSLLGEYGSGGSNSTGTAQYSACGVARCPAQKTASFRPGLRCKSSRYLRVSLWFAPCPDQKSIGFQRAAQRATPHDLPTASGPMPIAAVIKGQTYAVHSDHLNTPRKLTQPDGQVAWQWAYSAFGDEQPTIGAKRFTSETTTPTTGATCIPEVTFNLRYPGQYFDPETKLHYNYFRTYAPGTGRYTQGDPIGLAGGWNRFGYVEGNPLSRIDPSGLDFIVVTGGSRERSNPFGHSAVGVTGAGMYSYGNNTGLGSGPLSYITDQAQYRDQTITFIPRTPAQDQAALDNLSGNSCKNCVGILDNCAVRTDSALRAGGVNTGMWPFPGGVARDAMRAPGATTYYVPQGGSLPLGLVDALRPFNPPNVP